MCGICGAVWSGEDRPIDTSVLYPMNGRLRYHGPDDDGYYVGDGVMPGMRRLSNIDLETGSATTRLFHASND